MKETKKIKIVELLERGKSITEVSKELGVSKGYVSRIKKEMERENSMKKGELEAKIFELLEEGKSPTEIVIALKIPSDTVKEVYQKYLELEELPPIDVYDIEDEVLEVHKAVESIDKELKAEIRKLREEMADLIEKHSKRVLEDARNLIKNEKMEREKEYDATLGMIDVLLGIVGYLTVTELARVVSSQINIQIVKESPAYKLTREWAEMAAILRDLLNNTGHPSVSTIETVIDQLEIYKDMFKANQDKDAVKLFDEILREFKRKPYKHH